MRSTSLRFTALLLVGMLSVAALAATPGLDTASVGAGWHHVTFAERVEQEDRDALDAVGDLLQPAGGDTYIVWGDLAALRAVPGVGDVAPVTARVHPAAEGSRYLTILAHPSASQRLEASLAVGSSRTRSGLVKLLVPALAADLTALSSDPAVLNVGPAPAGLEPEDEASAQIIAGNSRFDVAPPGYRDFLQAHGLTGAGVNVSIVDTGVDRLHPDIADRVIAHLDYTPAGEPHDAYGHGTHVAGIVGGNGSSGGLEITDKKGRLYGLGVAPEVGLLDQNAIALTAGEWPPPYGFETLTSDAIDHETHIWNASWTTGEGTGVGYIATAAELDGLVRDGHAESLGSQPFTMVFSAGNSGPQLNTLTSPKEAKNLIVVAASENVRTLTGGTANGDAITSFSSRGPAMDGRVIPHVAAPGANIVSPRSTASAVCNLPPQDAGATMYGFCSGTSMAAPHVAGSVALLTEWWRGRSGIDPSPALAKALLVNTAQDLMKADVPNPHEGWGRINLGNMFDPSARRYVDDGVLMDELDQVHSRTIDVTDPTQPLRVTLAWTDAPGAPVAEPTDPALVNDLDLELVAPDGTVYRGNVFHDGWSVVGGDHDRIDNLENVFVEAPQVGTWTVHVRAHRLPGDGVPDLGDDTDQDFALVVSQGQLAD